VTVTRRLPATVEDELRQHFDLTGGTLVESDGVLCTVTDRLDREVLGRAPLRCRILANFGVGFNHIDLAAAGALGLVVTNTPGVLTDATAELTLALMLMAARRTGEGEREVRSGSWRGWRPTHLMGVGLTGRTLGIIGMGRIGQAVAERAAQGLGMRVIFVTRNPETTSHFASRCGELEELLEEADVVSLHAPASAETRHLIDARALGRMRHTAILVNTARGDLVDEEALADALAQGTIRAAGLDVYEHEPAVSPRLLALENVVLLPHLGSATESARIAMGRRALENLRAFFAGERPPDQLPLP
jgi:lactate dehydrogenase-like 2-hydroxyacid dehydrogenase